MRRHNLIIGHIDLKNVVEFALLGLGTVNYLKMLLESGQGKGVCLELKCEDK